jgi:hypothetical protein
MCKEGVVNNQCPECGEKGIGITKKVLGVGLICGNCGAKLTLEGYSSVFFGLLTFVCYHFLNAIYDISFIAKISIIAPPILLAIVLFVPLASKSNKFNQKGWLYAIAALMISAPFLAMGLYFVYR